MFYSEHVYRKNPEMVLLNGFTATSFGATGGFGSSAFGATNATGGLFGAAQNKPGYVFLFWLSGNVLIFAKDEIDKIHGNSS